MKINRGSGARRKGIRHKKPDLAEAKKGALDRVALTTVSVLSTSHLQEILSEA